jgi:hypothetical protein
MLADADAVIGALEPASPDVVWLQMSTIGEVATERCAEVARERSLTCLPGVCRDRAC